MNAQPRVARFRGFFFGVSNNWRVAGSIADEFEPSFAAETRIEGGVLGKFKYYDTFCFFYLYL